MTNNIPQTAIEFADKYGAKINSALEQLSAKIGVGVDHFWPILVAQQKTQGFIQLGTCLGFTLILLTFYIWVKRIESKYEDSRDMTFKGVMLFILIVASFIFLMAVSVNLAEMIGKIINPEYYALKDVALMIR